MENEHKCACCHSIMVFVTDAPFQCQARTLAEQTGYRIWTIVWCPQAESVYPLSTRRSRSGTSARYEGNEARDFIADLAAQVVRKAPHKFVGTLLSCLSCALWEDGDPYELINLPGCQQAGDLW